MPNARDRCYHHFPSVSCGNACRENIFNHVSSEAVAPIFNTLAEEAVLMCWCLFSSVEMAFFSEV